MHLTDRPAEAVIEFIGGMHPFFWHAFGDRVVGVANGDGEGVLGAVAGAGSLALLDTMLFT